MAIGNSVEDAALSYECDLTAERDRLRASNAELLTAMRTLLGNIGHDAHCGLNRPINWFCTCGIAQARAALARAEKSWKDG